MERQKTIGIIGVGMVGGALQRFFEKQGVPTFLYDPGRELGSLEEVNHADIVFVCVPTPFNKEKMSFDSTFIEDSFEKLEGSKVVVIKSTVLPGVTNRMQEKHPQHKVLFNPEFLSEATADDDMQNPDRQLVGYTEQSRDVAAEIMQMLPRAPFERTMPAVEAEMVKYFNNTFNAVKVIFANQMYDICQALGINYDSVADAAAASRFLQVKDHLTVVHKGYRGYGGKCLPKDIKALIRYAEDLGVDLALHRTADDINERLLAEQGIEDVETFSKREGY